MYNVFKCSVDAAKVVTVCAAGLTITATGNSNTKFWV